MNSTEAARDDEGERAASCELTTSSIAVNLEATAGGETSAPAQGVETELSRMEPGEQASSGSHRADDIAEHCSSTRDIQVEQLMEYLNKKTDISGLEVFHFTIGIYMLAVSLILFQKSCFDSCRNSSLWR